MGPRRIDPCRWTRARFRGRGGVSCFLNRSIHPDRSLRRLTQNGIGEETTAEGCSLYPSTGLTTPCSGPVTHTQGASPEVAAAHVARSAKAGHFT